MRKPEQASLWIYIVWGLLGSVVGMIVALAFIYFHLLPVVDERWIDHKEEVTRLFRLQSCASLIAGILLGFAAGSVVAHLNVKARQDIDA